MSISNFNDLLTNKVELSPVAFSFSDGDSAPIFNAYIKINGILYKNDSGCSQNIKIQNDDCELLETLLTEIHSEHNEYNFEIVSCNPVKVFCNNFLITYLEYSFTQNVFRSMRIDGTKTCS